MNYVHIDELYQSRLVNQKAADRTRLLHLLFLKLFLGTYFDSLYKYTAFVRILCVETSAKAWFICRRIDLIQAFHQLFFFALMQTIHKQTQLDQRRLSYQFFFVYCIWTGSEKDARINNEYFPIRHICIVQTNVSAYRENGRAREFKMVACVCVTSSKRNSFINAV